MNKVKHSIRIEPGDIVTPANFLTLIGVGLTVYGSFKITTGIGLFALMAGRILDLFDGPIARATHTSRFGAFMDAAGDKIAMLALLLACWKFDIAPWWAIVYVLAYNAISALLSVATELSGGRPEATRAGKYAVFLQNGTLIMYAIAALTEVRMAENFAIFIGIAGIVMSAGALEGYTVRLFKARHPA